MQNIDPEILQGFLDETFEIVQQCHQTLSDFTSSGKLSHFETFGRLIDQVMGASYTLSFDDLGNLTKLGKELSYKLSQVEDKQKQKMTFDLLTQLLEEVGVQLNFLKYETPELSQNYAPLMAKLKQASSDLGDLRSTLKIK